MSNGQEWYGTVRARTEPPHRCQTTSAEQPPGSAEVGPRSRIRRSTSNSGGINLCEHTFVSIKGSSYPRFRRALATGNLDVIRLAASELRSVDLGDALTICMVIRSAKPDRFDRASLRWLARYCLEQARSAADVQRAAEAFSTMAVDSEGALEQLRHLTVR